MKSVFYAATPLGVINAQEAIFKFKRTQKQNVLILFKSKNEFSSNLLKKIKSVIIDKLWTEVVIIEVKGPSCLSSKMLLLHAYFLGRSLGKVENLFIVHNDSNLTRSLIKYIDYNDLILFDDGIATLSLENENLETKELSFRSKFFGLSRPKDYILFTMFDIQFNSKHKQIIKNEYDFLKTQFKDVSPTNTCVILGQPLVELGYLSRELYFKRIKDYLLSISCDLVEVYYIPHHFEKSSHVNKIKTDLGLTIGELELPPEWEFTIGNSLRPKYVASFISTCLFTLPNLLSNEVRYQAFDVSSSMRGSHERDRFKVCYDYLKKENLVEVT